MVKESGPSKKQMAHLTLKSAGRFNEWIIDKVWRECREPMEILQCPKLITTAGLFLSLGQRGETRQLLE